MSTSTLTRLHIHFCKLVTQQAELRIRLRATTLLFLLLLFLENQIEVATFAPMIEHELVEKGSEFLLPNFCITHRFVLRGVFRPGQVII